MLSISGVRKRGILSNLISLYKAAGAKYFMCLANHHDNFDNYL